MRFALAWSSLRRHATRTLLATLGVGVAAAMLLDMVMMSTGLRESFRELLLSRGFQLRLAPKGTLPFDTDATIENTSAIVATLRSDRRIVTVSPVLGGTIHISLRGKIVTSAALGIDPRVQGDYELLSGKDPFGADEIVVNDAGSKKLIITGRVRFLYAAANQLATAMQLRTLQEMSGPDRRDDASLFMIKVRTDDEVESTRAWAERAIPNVSAISTASALAQVDQRLSYFRQLALILGTVSLFVGFLLVTTLMTVSVNERRISEITVMRALGVSRIHVVQQIVLEGIFITLGGAIAGLGLGLLTARYLNSILSSFPGLPVAIDFFLFQPKAAWTALGLLSLAGIAAGVYPSFRAASLPIATTLRQEAIA